MVCVVAEVIHTLPKGERVCGVATFKDNIYVLRWKGLEHVEVYDAITFRPKYCLDVPNLRGFTAMALCERQHCLYIGDDVGQCVHRVELNGRFTDWPVNDVPAQVCQSINDVPAGVSVNVRQNVLVTCSLIHKIKEFTTHGVLECEISLPDHVTNPWHTIHVPSTSTQSTDQLIVCHGDLTDQLNRVCKISVAYETKPRGTCTSSCGTWCLHHKTSTTSVTVDDRDIVQCHGGQPGESAELFRVPCHLAADQYEFVFVADRSNRRVTLLSPELNRMCDVVSRDSVTSRVT